MTAKALTTLNRILNKAIQEEVIFECDRDAAAMVACEYHASMREESQLNLLKALQKFAKGHNLALVITEQGWDFIDKESSPCHMLPDRSLSNLLKEMNL